MNDVENEWISFMKTRGCGLRGVQGFRAFDAFEDSFEALEAPTDTCNGLRGRSGTNSVTVRSHADMGEEQFGPPEFGEGEGTAWFRCDIYTPDLIPISLTTR